MISLMPNPEKDTHDRMVKGLTDETLKAAAKDLFNRKVHDRRNPEHRWILERRAALLRQLEHRRLRL